MNIGIKILKNIYFQIQWYTKMTTHMVRWDIFQGCKDGSICKSTRNTNTLTKKKGKFTWSSQDEEKTFDKIQYHFIIKSHQHGYRGNIMPFAATWMDLVSTILIEVNQTVKNTHPVIFFITYMWNLKKKWVQTNLFAEEKQLHRFWKQIYGYQRGLFGGRGTD